MNENMDRCDICGGEAEYRLITECRNRLNPWQTVPRAHPIRAYCIWHFFLHVEQLNDMRAKFVRDHPLQRTGDSNV